VVERVLLMYVRLRFDRDYGRLRECFFLILEVLTMCCYSFSSGLMLSLRHCIDVFRPLLGFAQIFRD